MALMHSLLGEDSRKLRVWCAGLALLAALSLACTGAILLALYVFYSRKLHERTVDASGYGQQIRIS